MNGHHHYHLPIIVPYFKKNFMAAKKKAAKKAVKKAVKKVAKKKATKKRK